MAEISAALDAQVDATARARSCDGAAIVANSLGSTRPHWAAEAAAFVAWRDAVWGWAFAQFALNRTGGQCPVIQRNSCRPPRR